MKLYVEVADKILHLIDQGTLKEGDKIPSIRVLSDDLGVSVNTVKEAYLLLENKKYIESKPQSGFFVKNINREFNRDRGGDSINLDPLKVSLCKIYSSQMINGSPSPEAGMAISSIDSSLLPKDKISHYFSETFKFHTDEALNYCMPPGYLPLREQIAIQSIRGGVETTPEDIIITSGCTDGVSLALMAICKPGDSIAIESPMYFNFIQMCQELRLNVIEIPNSEDRGLNIEALKYVLDYQNIKAFITIPNFTNPLGTMMSDSCKKELVECLEEYNIPLIEDDIYSELFFGKARPTTCKSFDKTGNVILCSSFSKNVSPGLRVGWMIPGKYYPVIERKLTLFHLGTSGIPQIALTLYLKEGGYERCNRKLRGMLKEQVTEMRDYILSVFPKETKINMPKGGVVLWVQCPKWVDTLELYNRVKKEGILFAPGTVFSLTGKFQNCLRLNAGVWNDRVKKGIDKIANLIVPNK